MTAPRSTEPDPGAARTRRYRRAKFSARLDTDCLYTAAHTWLRGESNGLWRVGYTKFAVRMLGEPVELDFEVADGAVLEVGQEVGWIEGFKAVSDIYTPLSGTFRGGNEALLADIELLGRDPHREGWLFRVEGTPGADCLDVDGYISVLDAAIDRILGNNSPP